jgi:hypothetical protein
VRGDAPLAQDEHLAADLLDHLELMRTVDDDPSRRGEAQDQAADDERRADIEARARLVEDDDRRIVD